MRLHSAYGGARHLKYPGTSPGRRAGEVLIITMVRSKPLQGINVHHVIPRRSLYHARSTAVHCNSLTYDMMV